MAGVRGASNSSACPYEREREAATRDKHNRARAKTINEIGRQKQKGSRGNKGKNECDKKETGQGARHERASATKESATSESESEGGKTK